MSQIQAFDFSVDLLRALLWQYNDAARLEALLRQKQEWYDANQETFWNDWIRDVFDLRTANDFGLNVWAILLNVPLLVASEDSGSKAYWGFGADRENFTHGNFSASPISRLTTEQKRLILRLRYFQLVTRGTVTEINEFFAYLFADLGRAYVVDQGDMQALYVFEFALPADFEMVLTTYDLLPRPAAVKVGYITLNEIGNWGFGRYHENFTNGNF
jgi:hypothetical protein